MLPVEITMFIRNIPYFTWHWPYIFDRKGCNLKKSLGEEKCNLDRILRWEKGGKTGVMNLGHSWTLVPRGNYGCSISLCTQWLTNGGRLLVLTRTHMELHVSHRSLMLLHLELLVVLSGRDMVLSFLSDMFSLSFRHSKL